MQGSAEEKFPAPSSRLRHRLAPLRSTGRPGTAANRCGQVASGRTPQNVGRLRSNLRTVLSSLLPLVPVGSSRLWRRGRETAVHRPRILMNHLDGLGETHYVGFRQLLRSVLQFRGEVRSCSTHTLFCFGGKSTYANKDGREAGNDASRPASFASVCVAGAPRSPAFRVEPRFCSEGRAVKLGGQGKRSQRLRQERR